MPYQTDPITIEYMGKWCIFGLRKLIAKCLSGTITVGHRRRFDFYTCQGTKVFVNQSDCARVNRFGWFTGISVLVEKLVFQLIRELCEQKRPRPLGAFCGQETNSGWSRKRPCPIGAFYGQELVKKRSFFINEYGNHCRLQIKPYQIRALKRAERPKTLEKHEQ